MKKTNETIKLLKNLKFEDAISYSVHSRIFEILGYLSLINNENLPDEVKRNIENIDKLSKSLIKEIHLIIDEHSKRKFKS